MTMIDEYLKLQDKYQKKYGEKTIVLYECGQFFEIYGVVNNEVKLGNIYEIADITNLSVSKKNNKYGPITKKNPLMAGFPNHSFEKWKNILLKNNYTIIKIEQDSHGKKNPSRNITEIISPGINIETKSFTNNLMSIFLEEINSNGNSMLFAGVSSIDILTGENTVYEIDPKVDDFNYTLDEIFRFIQSYNPNEIIINCENITLDQKYIINYLEITNYNVHFNYYKASTYLIKNKYKTEFLNKLFKNHGMLHVEEYINLEKKYFGLASYIYLLQFTYEHNETIIVNLSKPKIWDKTDHLILSYDSINQLNVIPNKNLKFNTKIDSLWNLIDKTSTSLGKRLLKEYIINPILSISELNKRYLLIDIFLKKKADTLIFITLEKLLEQIFDIERLHRRMAVGMLNPLSFSNLDISYQYIIKIINTINSYNDDTLNALLPNKEIITTFNEFIFDYNSKLNMNIINRFTLSNLRKSIFKENIYDDIDKLQKKIDTCLSFFTKLSIFISNKIDTNKQVVDIKENDRDGHYFSTSKKRAQLFKSNIQNIHEIKIKLDNNIEVIVPVNSIQYKIFSSYTKMYCPQIKNYSEQLHFYQEKMKRLCTTKFNELLITYNSKYSQILKHIVHFIAFIDVIKSNAKTAFKYGYKKPTIINKHNSKSYIEATDLRHPIIEQINTELEYIPNNVNLGININGMLLYGVNAVGKSSYMKSVGLSIIMAQAGMFVPANYFNYYPYKYIFTRISGNDNIFKGQSTFAVEMSELRSILKRANKNSLVLGDELCSGTETVSGLAIVASGVITLDKRNCSFIFATHLHKLSSMNRIILLDKVQNFHMETIYNKETQKLIYNRKIKSGSGNAIYGLEVARAMDLDIEFITLANNIRKEILGINIKLLTNKTSQYNSKIIMDLCKVCGEKATEVHHIKPQLCSDQHNMIGNHHQNVAHNLIQLCHICHQNVENGTLHIDGYIMTTKGKEPKLQTKQKKKRKKKYTDNEIDIIFNYKNIETNNICRTQKLLELNNNIKVSYTTIRKIWNKVY